MKPYYGYLFFNVLGLIAAFGLSRFLRFKIYENLSAVDKVRIMMGLVLGVILGAKIPVLLSYGLSLEYLWTGKSLYGGVLGAYAGVNIIKNIYKIPGNYGDRYVIPLCVAVGIGDIGCLVNGCCGGLPTEQVWHIRNAAGIFVHPTQIYTSLFHLLSAAGFYVLYRKGWFYQLHFIIYLLTYSAFRFFIEFIRCEPRVWDGLTVYQWMALCCIPYFIGVILRRWKAGIGRGVSEVGA